MKRGGGRKIIVRPHPASVNTALAARGSPLPARRQLAILGREHAGESPVLRLDFLNHDVRVLGSFAEHAHERVGELGDDLGLLPGGHAVPGDLQIDVRHVEENNARPGPRLNPFHAPVSFFQTGVGKLFPVALPSHLVTAELTHRTGNAPRNWRDYLMYPRVLFTSILCFVVLVLHVAFGLYVWVFQK